MAKFARRDDNHRPDDVSRPDRSKIRFDWFIDDYDFLSALTVLGTGYKASYTVDTDYQEYVFKDCTMEDVLYIVQRLNREYNDKELETYKLFKGDYEMKPGQCAKATRILSLLNDRFYNKNLNILLTAGRGATCACHNPLCLHKRN